MECKSLSDLTIHCSAAKKTRTASGGVARFAWILHHSATIMFMSTRQAIERLRLATDSPSMRTVRSALDGQDRTASTGCLWQGYRQA